LVSGAWLSCWVVPCDFQGPPHVRLHRAGELFFSRTKALRERQPLPIFFFFFPPVPGVPLHRRDFLFLFSFFPKNVLLFFLVSLGCSFPQPGIGGVLPLPWPANTFAVLSRLLSLLPATSSFPVTFFFFPLSSRAAHGPSCRVHVTIHLFFLLHGQSQAVFFPSF